MEWRERGCRGGGDGESTEKVRKELSFHRRAAYGEKTEDKRGDEEYLDKGIFKRDRRGVQSSKDRR